MSMANIIQGTKRRGYKHKIEKLKQNAELFLQYGTRPQVHQQKEKLHQGAQERGRKEIEEEAHKKQTCSEEVSRSNVSFNWCLLICIF